MTGTSLDVFLVAGEASLPEGVIQNDDAITRFIFLGKKTATQDGLDPKH